MAWTKPVAIQGGRLKEICPFGKASTTERSSVNEKHSVEGEEMTGRDNGGERREPALQIPGM